MPKPKLFIGSSGTNYRAAEIIAEQLEECAAVTTWKEGVFGLNKGFLETLLARLEEYDYAVFVLAADDVTTGRDGTRPSPRDNVLFESGLFMGVLGRERVFLVFDESAGVRIPSDLLGITLAPYDGTRISGDQSAAAVRSACRLIRDRITESRFAHLVGDWASRYLVTVKVGSPAVDEVVEVRPCRDGLSLTTKENPQNDYYSSVGRMLCERQMSGRWKSRSDLSDAEGLFLLAVAASSDVMYGYFTASDVEDRLVYGTWVLAKKDGAEEEEIQKRLTWGQDLLKRATVGPK